MPFPAALTQTLNTFRLAPYPTVTGLPQPVTSRSLGEFFFALAWGWLLLVSFIGWGRLAGKLLRVRQLPASVACSLGIAVVIFFGGWLNLFHAIYGSLLIALVVAGLLLYLWLRKERPEAYGWLAFWKQAPHWSRALVILTLLILIFRVAATVRLPCYHSYDDATAYLAFPQRMLASHQFAADPFSDRRVISSLGGSCFLQAFVLVATSLSNIGMADRALGLMLMLVAIFDLGIAFGLSRQWIAFMGFLAYLVPQETFNLTFIILPIPLFLVMMWMILGTIDQPEKERWRQAAIMGAVGGAVLCLKSTFLPYVGALALFPYLLLFGNKKRSEAVKLPVIAGVASLLVVAAWMLAMKHESGTYLFPILGHGVDYSSYGLFPHLSQFSGRRAFVRVFLQGVALLILAAVQYVAGIKEDKSRFGFGVLIAAALAITAFNYESGAAYIWRYNFPQFFTAILIFFAAAASCKVAPISRRCQLNRGLAVAALAGCIFYYDVRGGSFAPFHQMGKELALSQIGLNAGVSGLPMEDPQIMDRYRAIEQAVPPGSVTLDVTPRTFLLRDVGRRRFLIDDWSGAASPKPGWPFSADPEAAAAFLRRNSVDYIVYDYAYGAWVDMISCQALMNQAHFSQLDRALEVLTFVTHHQFDQLRATHHLLYDDGKIAVIDLTSPKNSKAAMESSWTLNTSETQMCSQIAQRYTSTHVSYPMSAKPSPCE